MENIKVRDRKDTFIEIDKLAPDPNNFWSADFLKVWMIFLVILDHSVPHNITGLFHSVYWERIAIPVFMVVLGFNWGKSLSRKKDQSLKSLYSWEGYWKPKIKRFVVPYAIIFGLSLVYLLVAYLVRGPNFLLDLYAPEYVPSLHNPLLKIALILPVWGPGNWFIPMLFMLIVMFPLLYKFFTITRWFSWIALIVCYGIEIAFQYSGQYIVNTYGFGWYMNFFTFIPLQLLTAIALGLWLSIDHKWGSPRNIIIWLLGIASTVFIIYSDVRGGYPRFAADMVVFDYNLFIYPYSALIVMMVLNIIPKSPMGPHFRNLTSLSKATYHILMTQIFYFSLVYGLVLKIEYPFGTFFNFWNVRHYGTLVMAYANFLWFYPLNIAITFLIGYGWYRLGKRFWEGKSVTSKRISQKRLEMMKAKGWIK
ncbi:MAG: acyltransferase family protein [Promethearchaeota archaeon]